MVGQWLKRGEQRGGGEEQWWRRVREDVVMRGCFLFGSHGGSPAALDESSPTSRRRQQSNRCVCVCVCVCVCACGLPAVKDMYRAQACGEYICKPSLSWDENRAEVVEEESVAWKRPMVKQRKRLLKGWSRPKYLKSEFCFSSPATALH